MKRFVHGIAGMFAILLIVLFISATLYVEWLGSEAMVLRVKQSIAFPGIEVLVVLLMIAGATGQSLAKGKRSPVVSAKAKRMRIAAINGALFLIPSALLLAYLAKAGRYTSFFYVVQSVELLFGFINLGILIMNLRDGIRLAAGRRSGQKDKDEISGHALEKLANGVKSGEANES